MRRIRSRTSIVKGARLWESVTVRTEIVRMAETVVDAADDRVAADVTVDAAGAVGDRAAADEIAAGAEDRAEDGTKILCRDFRRLNRK